MPDPELYKSFTLVFEGDIRKLKMNPLNTETPWGKPYGVCCWDAMEHADQLREALERSPQESVEP